MIGMVSWDSSGALEYLVPAELELEEGTMGLGGKSPGGRERGGTERRRGACLSHRAAALLI